MGAIWNFKSRNVPRFHIYFKMMKLFFVATVVLVALSSGVDAKRRKKSGSASSGGGGGGADGPDPRMLLPFGKRRKRRRGAKRGGEEKKNIKALLLNCSKNSCALRYVALCTRNAGSRLVRWLPCCMFKCAVFQVCKRG